MTPSPEYDRFVKSVSSFSRDIGNHSLASWNGINFNSTEPEIIKKYLLGKGVGVDYLNRNLAPILSHASYEVKFASVFIHQKPRITRHISSTNLCAGDTPSCELGDLLVVFCLLDKNKIPMFRSAVISQAKKERSMTSQSQQCLYDSDVVISLPARIYSSSPIKMPDRNLPDYSQGRTKALHYLILDRMPTLRQVPWNSNLEYSWAHFLRRILLGDLGLPFQNMTPLIPDWNCIIHDLLNIGNGIIPSSIKRGNALVDIVNIFNDFNEYDNYSLEIENEQGLPTLFIIVRDREYEIQSN
ncbi:hypothetical protein [Chryseosolibacter indicus]|uniref:Uncharacterized protein n=1 Tax=Chryseosolibacter indicus TaxID=2782351 RepID=A0ABS5W0M5_9BACT|nr:hypothetical protein [Chryseosolibacter indicus]MBT1706519.1 hypothetical protein [Chryseosolibacter indicus]